ncbi:D12 class N6 adenine-specific DNA methyltransferase [Brevinema andersonii]|uniref:D12 class N6 adenine-specific DNA methyltransferase n=3 Tax=Brevinema andersonii TaxID=34097 RepID=A0A1I1E613_BREAD|nr:D12 class N6 adenine-specific DNA methyltransferase [Brevinema andersonii]
MKNRKIQHCVEVFGGIAWLLLYKDTLHLTDIQKAAGTLIKYGWSFSGQGTSYAFEVLNSAQTLISKISELRERFRNLAISNESFEKCIKRWDQENTFLYLDPPYFGAENVYPGINFGVEWHVLLSELLKNSKATWMLSYGDHSVIRELYKDFHITEATVKYSGLANSKKHPNTPELVITSPLHTQKKLNRSAKTT